MLQNKVSWGDWLIFVVYERVLASKEDHSDCDCFAVAVLSHGDKGLLYGTDNSEIDIDTFIGPIKDCRTLAGKPKIFIIQVSRLHVVYNFATGSSNRV